MKSKRIGKTLESYMSRRETIRFDVPAHKGQPHFKDFDRIFGKKITTLDTNSSPELDNLTNPRHLIKWAEERAAKLFKVSNAKFLVNGTTIGIQTMIMAAVKENETIIVPTNIHKSVYNALILSGAKPIYVEPTYNETWRIDGGLDPAKVNKLIEEIKPKAILLINPSYYGESGGIHSIVRCAKQNNVLVLGDEAHGGHLYFSNDTIPGLMQLGADVSCVSTHKTMGSLTQTSILLHNDQNISQNEIQKTLNLLQTTSPSYLLISSLDETVAFYLQKDKEVMKKTSKIIERFKEKIEKINGIELLSETVFLNQRDRTKLIIRVNDLGMSGFAVYEILRRKYQIQMEMADDYVVVGLVSFKDTNKTLDHLLKALKQIAKKRSGSKKFIVKELKPSKKMSDYTPREIYNKKGHKCSLNESAIGKINKEVIMIYPPGIALLSPGEIITIEHIIKILEYKAAKISIIGLDKNKIEVI